jgi:hypothetical protein
MDKKLEQLYNTLRYVQYHWIVEVPDEPTYGCAQRTARSVILDTLDPIIARIEEIKKSEETDVSSYSA